METHSEVDRLVRVYREYHDRDFRRTKWSDSNAGNLCIQHERNRALGRLLERTGCLPLGGKRILEVGCGAGGNLVSLIPLGATQEDLVGIDLLEERIDRARQEHPQIAFQVANAESLPFAAGGFDLVMVFTVFSSILDRGMAGNVAGEIDRVLRAGGAVIWYDFRRNNPFNPAVRGVSRRAVRQLFPGFESVMVTLTLLPPLARRLGFLTRPLYPLLAALPFLRTHFLGILFKR